MKGIIYKYTSPNGKIYIGQTTQEKRRRATFLNINKSYGGEKIDNARQKYTPQAFSYEVLCSLEFSSPEEARIKLDALEEHYIKLYDSYRNGYNMTLGGYTTTGMKASEETRKKLSEIRKGRKGTPLTEEQKKAHSERLKELWADPEWRSEYMKACTTEEYRKKKSEMSKGERNGMFGKKATAEARAKMSASRTGKRNHNYAKTLSAEHRRKCQEAALKRKPMSAETKAKLKVSLGEAVCQLSMDGILIAEYPNAKAAAKAIGKESSCILKCCKGQRGMAYGFKWKYANPQLLELDNLDRKTWIPISEAIGVSGHKSVVLYYHMNVIKDIPFKQYGNRRFLHKPSIVAVFGKKA